MRQSVMANAVATGSSGVGFAMRTVLIREVQATKNICLATDTQTNESFQLGLNKRGDSAVWPLVDDVWLIDRSMGHWSLKCRITATAPPVFTSTSPSRTKDMAALIEILSSSGIIADTTGTSAVPVISGSRDDMTPAIGSLIDALGAQGIIQDQTTAPTVPIGVWQTVPGTSLTSPWVLWADPSYQAPRYRRLPFGEVVVEGLVGTGGVSVSSPTTVFTLAPGYRPLKTLVFTCEAGGTSVPCVQMEVNSAGNVLFRPPTGSINFVTLNCRFSVT